MQQKSCRLFAKTVRSIGLIVLLAAVPACSTKFSADSTAPGSGILRPGDRVIVVQPADGEYDGRRYAGSGRTVRELAEGLLRERGIVVLESNSTRPRSGGMDGTSQSGDSTACEDARAAGAEYACLPRILHWEPRMAAWSGRPTRVALRVDICDAREKTRTASVSMNAIGKRITFASQSAGDLALEILRHVFDGLVARQPHGSFRGSQAVRELPLGPAMRRNSAAWAAKRGRSGLVFDDEVRGICKQSDFAAFDGLHAS